MEKRVVFDIGFNNGDDTAHYLARGFDVVAVEANPILVERGRERFAEAISAGRLQLLGVGIAETEGTLDFYVNHANDGWSSFVEKAGVRDGKFSVISVPTTTIQSICARFGTPYYLKIDIEGHDLFCIRDLPVTPEYISIEAHHLEYLAILYSKGYRQFKVVNQANHFPNGSSGPMSDTITDWDTLTTAAYDYLHTRVNMPHRSSLGYGWYDFHAKLGGPELGSGYAKKPLRFRELRRHYAHARFKLRTAVKSLIGYKGASSPD